MARTQRNRARRPRRTPGVASVIIPALNEARTIASVVRFARRDPMTAEVIVIDDGSIDGTPELAEAAGRAW
jgi:glycosyltransferase involved in cell wall biosynthesis